MDQQKSIRIGSVMQRHFLLLLWAGGWLIPDWRGSVLDQGAAACLYAVSSRCWASGKSSYVDRVEDDGTVERQREREIMCADTMVDWMLFAQSLEQDRARQWQPTMATAMAMARILRIGSQDSQARSRIPRPTVRALK